MIVTLIIPRLSPMWPTVIPPSWLWPLFGRDPLSSVAGSLLVVYLFAVGLIASITLTTAHRLLRRQGSHSSLGSHSPHLASRGLSWGWQWLRRLVGGALLILGVVLLVLPGPGMLAIVWGLVLGDYRFFHALEGKLRGSRRILAVINRIRGLLGIAKLPEKPSLH